MQFRSVALRACLAASICAGALGSAHAASYTVLHALSGSTDGNLPLGALVQARDGNFYGTTSQGGASDCQCGTIFRITPGGAFTLLHTFTGADGANPQGPMMLAADGNLYGTTKAGGTGDAGTIFRITTGGAFRTMHSFQAVTDYQNADGSTPTGRLIQLSDGNFYGTALVGGNGDGAIFRMAPDGTVTNLHNLLYGEGGLPKGGLVLASDGYLYGSTIFYGQNADVPNGGTGTVFRISPTTLDFSVVHVFNTTDGTQINQLMIGTDGKIYGTAPLGGANNDGTIFTISPAGVVTTLYSFNNVNNNAPYGDAPQDSLVQGLDGNFYGTTIFGGSSGGGVIFKMTPSGTVTNIHDFGGPGDGYWPNATVTRGSDGNFYGVTQYGGAAGGGVIFMMPGPSAPPVWVSPPTPANDTTFNLTATRPFSIALRASHQDPAAIVHVDSVSKPGASVVTPFDGNPGNATFSWTPQISGDFVATFKASLAGAPLLASPVRTIKLHVVKRATSIAAQPAAAEVNSLSVHLHTIAILSAENPSAPLAGKTVAFTTTDNQAICTSVTDANGRADCTGAVNLTKAVLSRGYIATFAGDATYAGSSQYGYLIQ